MAVLILCAVILIVPMLLKRDWQLKYFSILISLLFSVFLTYFVSAAAVAKAYVVILCALGIYSVVATYGLRELAQAGKLNPAPSAVRKFGLTRPARRS